MTVDAAELSAKIRAVHALVSVTENSLSHWNRGEISPDDYFAEICTLSMASKHLSEVAIALDRSFDL